MTKLNRDEKGQVVAEVVERLERTETVVTADFRGLTVAELAELRGKLRDVEAEMTVVKNTLSRRAADQTGRAALVPYLSGPTGLVWVNGDPAQAAKALSDFAKAHQDVFTIRGGVLGNEDLPAASIIKLASLPSREQMLGQLAGALVSPISGLAGRLNSMIGNLARTLAAVGESGALAPGEAPAVEAPPVAEEAPAEATDTPAADEAPPADDAPAADVPEDDAPAAETAAQDAPADDAPAEVADAAPAEIAEEPVAEVASEDTPSEEPAPAEAPDTDDSAGETPAPDAPAEGESETPES